MQAFNVISWASVAITARWSQEAQPHYWVYADPRSLLLRKGKYASAVRSALREILERYEGLHYLFIIDYLTITLIVTAKHFSQNQK